MFTAPTAARVRPVDINLSVDKQKKDPHQGVPVYTVLSNPTLNRAHPLGTAANGMVVRMFDGLGRGMLSVTSLSVSLITAISHRGTCFAARRRYRTTQGDNDVVVVGCPGPRHTLHTSACCRLS